MYTTTMLEWLFKGEWRRIGWVASTPKSTEDLREHGRKLAASGGQYRLVQPSVYAGQPDEVVHVYATEHAEVTR